MNVTDRLVPSPWVWQVFAKYYYPVLTRLFAGGMPLINLGYEEDPPMALPLAPSDEPNRFLLQLYHRTATQVDLNSKRVLEVSCGHGGGASYLVRTLHPASYTGLDLNRAGIDFCRKTFDLAGLDFVHGDAENLPFADRSFDAVLNIEASHCYAHLPRFLAEVARVLRPGGHFLYADLRPRALIGEWEAALADAPMRLASERIIDDEVARGLLRNSTRSPDLIGRRVPRVVLAVIRFGGRVVDWALRRVAGSTYRMYCFAKD
jgi:SAM-dependent methyltransferase